MDVMKSHSLCTMNVKRKTEVVVTKKLASFKDEYCITLSLVAVIDNYDILT